MREDPYVDDIEDLEEPDTAPARKVRTASARQTIPAYDEPAPSTWEDASPWDDTDDAYDELPPEPVSRRQPRQRPAIQRPTIARPTMPRVISNADVLNDVPALVFIAISTLGLAAMAILVANRISTLDEVIPTHVSASGLFERFASRETIWQIPLLATMLTLMNIAAAWFVSPLDRFASRFLLATSVVVQFVAWVAVIRVLY